MPKALCLVAMALVLCAAAVAAPRVVPFAHVGFIPGDKSPEARPCVDFDLQVGMAWDYGSRSLVIEFPAASYLTRVLLTSDIKSNDQPKLTRDTLRLYTSLDNHTYVPYAGPRVLKVTRSQQPGKEWEVEISGLQVLARYFKINQTYDGPAYGIGFNKLTEAVQVFNDEGWAGEISLDGLYVAPAQRAGQCSPWVKVTTPKADAFALQFEAENTETNEKLLWNKPAVAGKWAPVPLESKKLVQGPWWLRVRLMYRQTAVAQLETVFRVQSECPTESAALTPLKPGGALVLRDLAKVCQGGKPFAYTLPGEAAERQGLALEKGDKLTLKPALSGDVAVYVGVSQFWPDLRVTWGKEAHTVAGAQEDWPFDKGTQEVLAGYGSFASDGLVLEATGGPCKLYHVRLARLTPDELKLYQHVNDPTHNRRVIYNNDGFSELWGVKDWDRKRLLDLVERYEGTDTAHFEMCCLVSSWVNFPSKFATFWKVGEVPADQWVRDNDRMAVELFNQLERDGLPIFPTLAARGKEIGVPVWGSLRMSAYYNYQEQQTLQPFNGKLFRDHPEYRILGRDGKQWWELSFAHDAVRQERLGVLSELAEMGCEGVMMDFCRYPYVLGYDKPLVEAFKAKYGVDPHDVPENDERWVSLRCAVMNDFFRSVRQRMDEIGKRQGRKIGIAVRVPATEYREYGFDPQTWAKEKLMDLFIPHYPGLERDFDVKPWMALCKGTGIQVYPGIEVTKSQSSETELTDAQLKRGIKPGHVISMSADDYRRKVWRRYRDGADGAFLFNIWTMGCSKNQLGDKVNLARWSYFEDPLNLPRTTLP